MHTIPNQSSEAAQYLTVLSENLENTFLSSPYSPLLSSLRPSVITVRSLDWPQEISPSFEPHLAAKPQSDLLHTWH